MNTNLEDVILKAIDIVASKRIASAEYDKTIQATIVSCIDATIGKYKVKYQDSFLYAYSSNINTSFPIGTNVFILIPNGDMSKDKTILGTTKKLGINYITAAEGDLKYEPIGTNVVSTSGLFELCSYQESEIVLYSYDKSINKIAIDAGAAAEYLKSSSYLNISADIRTKLPLEQQYQGDYGILVGLDFKDNATEEIVTRYYIVDIDNMTGNPYRLVNKTKQYGIFEIDGSNFVRINLVALFVKNFPEEKAGAANDIFISGINITGAGQLSQEDLDNCALVLITPKGYIFNLNSSDTDTRTILAQVRVKGKTVDLLSQSLPIYWFVEDISITAKNLKYNKYGGQGWRCLNSYTTIKSGSSGAQATPAVIDFIPGKNILTIKKSEILAKSVKYKCAVIYDGTIFTKLIQIINNNADYNFFIESDKGTKFYYDSGYPTLTCRCQQKNSSGSYVDMSIVNLKFVWSVINNVGTYESLPNTDEYNADQAKLQLLNDSINGYLNAEYLLYQHKYNHDRLYPSASTISAISDTTKRNRVQTIKNNLTNGGITSGSAIDTLLNKYSVTYNNVTYQNLLNGSSNSLRTALAIYNTRLRVLNNKIVKLNVKNITNFSTFKCSVFSKVNNAFLGTASIVIINALNGESLYSLVINNGAQVFKYNTHGISPVNKQNTIPYEISALTFTVYDNLGNPIDDDIIKHSDITWTVPSQNTLLKVSDYSGYPDATGTKMIYKNLMMFNYSIEDRFNAKKTDNNILLKVNYKGLNLVAKTDFTFTKEGAAGTNGTDFTCRIVPNASGTIPLYPTIYYNGSSIDFNFTRSSTSYWFKAELWHNGLRIYSGYSSSNSSENKFVTVLKWEILKNTYSSTVVDRTNLNITAAGACSFSAGNLSGNWNESNYKAWRAANIVKVTLSYDGYTYYATLPVIIVRSFNTGYRVNLKENTGFRLVLYSSSGVNPTFDSHAPFELIVERNESGNWLDVSNKTTNDYKMNYTWYYMASVYRRTSSSGWTEDIENTSSGGKWLMTATASSLRACQKAVKPADNYDGECVNTAIACQVYNSSGTTLAWIHIPVHMLRNRFENSAINGWDGNSIDLGDGTGTILAPQVGAGVKDSNNRFTGIVIGTSRNPLAGTSTINNTGNASQGVFANAGLDVGLFGYHEGSRSIFLDAKTGKAEFGLSQKAKIIMDPSSGTAQIKSGNYNTSNKTGMLIDLTTPEIKFGSGNFSVNSSGYLISKGGGSVAGWNINDNSLYKNNTGMNSNTSTASGSGAKIISTKIPSSSGDYQSVNKAAAFYAGNSNNFYVTHDGYLKVSEASIGNGTYPVFIGGNGSNSFIFSGRKSTKNANISGFYLGTDGVGLGSSSSILNKNGSYETISNFQVDNDGTLYARQGYIGNGRSGWLIKSDSLQNGKSNLNDITNAQGVFLGVPGISLGRAGSGTSSNPYAPAFKVDNSGNLSAVKGNIANWQLSKDKITYPSTNVTYSGTSNNQIYFGTQGLRIGQNFHVDASNGNLYAKGNATIEGLVIAKTGKIADWIINNGGIQNSNGTVYFRPSGLQINNFAVNQTGTMTLGSLNNTSKGFIKLDANTGSLSMKTAATSTGIGTFELNAMTGNLTLSGGTGSSFIVNTITGKLLIGGGYGNGTFSVESNGTINLNSVTGGTFKVNANDGTLSLSNFSVNGNNGTLTIDDFSVNGSNGTLTVGSNFTVSKNGAIKGLNWNVSADGVAHFKNVKIDGGTFGSSSGGGPSFSGGSISPGSIQAGSGNMNEWAEEIAVNKINAKYIYGQIADMNSVRIKSLVIETGINLNPSTAINVGNGASISLNSGSTLAVNGSLQLNSEGSQNTIKNIITADYIRAALGLSDGAKIATQTWVENKGYLTALPAHTHSAGTLKAGNTNVTGSTGGVS